MKNRMREVAELLGVQLDEPFKVINSNGSKIQGKFVITEDGLLNGSGNIAGFTLNNLLNGSNTLVKIPYQPKFLDQYYTFTLYGSVISSTWQDDEVDYFRKNAGMVFKTEEEISVEFIKTTIKKLKGDN